jgi:hypothetical protein
MTQKEQLLALFHFYGNKLTLGQLLEHSSGVGYKCTSRFSDLRKEGYVITCVKGVRPSENLYCLVAEPGQKQAALAF